MDRLRMRLLDLLFHVNDTAWRVYDCVYELREPIAAECGRRR